ncbi:MAG: CIA30 family protein [Desulfovibrionales bacterium]
MKTAFLVTAILTAMSFFLLEGTGMGSDFEQGREDSRKTIRLGDLQWHNRIIVVFVPQGESAKALEAQFQEAREEVQDRDIRYFLIEENIRTNGPEVLNKEHVRELRDAYDSSVNDLTVVLIGKDGSEKYRKNDLDLDEIFETIDAMPMRAREMQQTRTRLFNFRDPETRAQWATINDDVMGGVSHSEITFTDEGTAVFQGTLSLENNGGFASTRSGAVFQGLEDCRGLVVQVRGDGKRYQLRVRTDEGIDTTSYRYSFATRAGEWRTIHMPFAEFEPVFRGRVLDDAPPLAPGRIRQLGFLISEKQAGPFRLEIRSIQGYEK